MVRRLRLISGFILFTYVLTHLANHSLGIVSIAAMESMLSVVYPVWSYPPVTLLTIWRAYRSCDACPLRGLAAASAQAHARGSRTIRARVLCALAPRRTRDQHAGCCHVLWRRFRSLREPADCLWYDHPFEGMLQVGLLLAAWIHACIGLQFWLRLRPWYDSAQPFLYAAALVVPVLAILGYVAGGQGDRCGACAGS